MTREDAFTDVQHKQKYFVAFLSVVLTQTTTQGLAESSKADKTGDEHKDERDEWKIDGGIKGIKDREMVDRRREVERGGRQIEVGRNKDG